MADLPWSAFMNQEKYDSSVCFQGSFSNHCGSPLAPSTNLVRMVMPAENLSPKPSDVCPAGHPPLEPVEP